MIVDGKNCILGRMASFVAKELLNGRDIDIVNADKIIITGNPINTIKKYHERRKRGSPQHGPFFPKKPELIVKRAVRGMLPYKTLKGRSVFKKLHVYQGIPKEFEGKKFETFGRKTIKTNFITIKELAKAIGDTNA